MQAPYGLILSVRRATDPKMLPEALEPQKTLQKKSKNHDFWVQAFPLGMPPVHAPIDPLWDALLCCCMAPWKCRRQFTLVYVWRGKMFLQWVLSINDDNVKELVRALLKAEQWCGASRTLAARAGESLFLRWKASSK